MVVTFGHPSLTSFFFFFARQKSEIMSTILIRSYHHRPQPVSAIVSLCIVLIAMMQPAAVDCLYRNAQQLASRRHLVTPCRAAPSDKGKKPSTKSKFDRVVDDFIGKRYGAGEYFYGRQTSKLSDDEYAAEYGPVMDDDGSDAVLRDNAILLVGSLDELGQWVAFELAEKGFNIRVAACAGKAKAVNVFGLRNVDIVEVGPSSSSLEQYAAALAGVQAVVFMPAFKPFFGPLGGAGRDEFIAAERLLDVAVKQVQAAQSDVQKVVCVSRAMPWVDVGGSGSGLLNALVSGAADSGLYSAFRQQHAAFEEKVRSSGFEYVVVRAPAVVEEAKEGARSDLVILDRAGEATSISASNAVGTLDFAEAVSSALVVDVPAITFTVCESASGARALQQELQEQPLVQSNAMDEEYGAAPARTRAATDRVQRQAYYGILDMDEGSMKSSYMMKEAEVYEKQLEEDVSLERFWTERLSKLPKD